MQSIPGVRPFLVVLSLVAAPAWADEPAPSPCEPDVQRLCADVPAGGGKLRACLRRNEPQLSPACRARMEADDQEARDTVQQFGRSCRADVAEFCSRIAIGDGVVFDCLESRLPRLTRACQAEMTRIVSARSKVAAVRAACKADVARLCIPVPKGAGEILECLQAHRAELSPDCDAGGVRRAAEAAAFVDILDEMTSKDRVQESLQILQGLDAVAFSRSQVIFQLDSFQSLGGKGNGGRMLLNPQFVFGSGNEFALQFKLPVLGLFPYQPGTPSQFGLGAVATAVAWNFLTAGGVKQFVALGIQWPTASSAPIGGPWAIVPSYAVGLGLWRLVSLTVQVQWNRSLGSSDRYPEVNLLILEPIVAVNLPGRAYVAVDTRLGWSFVSGTFIPLMKFAAGIFTDRERTVSISAWYQPALSQPAADEVFKYSVGAGLAYFFDW
ncbi:MAG: cysteine rich repeat-containing protein [Anaeromyxobacteraceae bacterium]